MNSSAQFVLVFGFCVCVWGAPNAETRTRSKRTRARSRHERVPKARDERRNVSRVRTMTEVGRGETAAQLRISHAICKVMLIAGPLSAPSALSAMHASRLAAGVRMTSMNPCNGLSWVRTFLLRLTLSLSQAFGRACADLIRPVDLLIFPRTFQLPYPSLAK